MRHTPTLIVFLRTWLGKTHTLWIVRRIIRSYLILEFRKYLVYIYYETDF